MAGSRRTGDGIREAILVADLFTAQHSLRAAAQIAVESPKLDGPTVKRLIDASRECLAAETAAHDAGLACELAIVRQSNDEYRRRVAYHEAGHAVVAHLSGARIESVGIEESERHSGGLRAHRPPHLELEDARTHAGISLAGFHSQSRLNPAVELGGWDDDFRDARDLLSRDDALSLDEELRRVHAFTAKLVRQWWPAIERIAEKLLERGSLGDEEVAALVCEEDEEPAATKTRPPPAKRSARRPTRRGLR